MNQTPNKSPPNSISYKHHPRMLLQKIRDALHNEHQITWEEEDQPIVIRTKCKDKNKIPSIVNKWKSAILNVSNSIAENRANSIYINIELEESNIYVNIFPTTGTVMIQGKRIAAQWLYSNAPAINAELQNDETTTSSKPTEKQSTKKEN